MVRFNKVIHRNLMECKEKKVLKILDQAILLPQV